MPNLTIQPIETVEGILRKNLTLISRAPRKCLQISNIENQLGLPRMRPGVYIEMPDVLLGWNKGRQKGQVRAIWALGDHLVEEPVQ